MPEEYTLKKTENFNFDAFAARWPSPVVARERVGEFSGGALTAGTMANHDSKGEGPPRLRLGRKIVYPVVELVEWMKARTEAVS